MSDPTALPRWLVAVVVGLPFVLAVAFGSLAFRRMTKLVFHCRRCDRDFMRKAWLRFPRRCGLCGARDWAR